MLTRILASTMLLGGLTLAAMAAEPSTASTQTQATTGASTQSKTIPQELRQKLTSAGYTDVEIVPSSFLVSAKNKDGNKVMMRISPNSMTMLTEVPVASTTGAATPDTSETSKTK